MYVYVQQANILDIHVLYMHDCYVHTVHEFWCTIDNEVTLTCIDCTQTYVHVQQTNIIDIHVHVRTHTDVPECFQNYPRAQENTE